jgi:pSer/pThr/pTyr-binding forkhead associated (FHA) protein/uncharacterized RDD family membrane protein YckC
LNQVDQTGWQIFVEVPGKAPVELPAGESVIGRSRACAVQIAETTVSRQHAIFIVEPGKVRLRDLGSSNGTFVNGQRVDGEMPLADGDRVVVGEAELVLRMLAPLGPSEATAKLVIPPLTAPPGPVHPVATAPPAAAAVRAAEPPRVSLASGSHAAWAPTPLSRIPAPPAPPGPATPAVSPLDPAPSPAPSPVELAAPPPAPPVVSAPAPTAGELLSSISDIELAPVPPPAPRHSPVAPPVAKATMPGKVEPAGFWLRVVAYVLDYIPVALLGIAYWVLAVFVSPSWATKLSFVLPIYGLLVVLVLPALKGTTPGKKILRLAIVSDTTGPGEGLGWTTATLRLLGHFVCGLTFGLGYLLVAFSARKQGLHDLIAKTNVVRTR